MTQIKILRTKHNRNRVIVAPEHRLGLMAIGQELNHDVKDVLGIVTPQTYRRWLREQKEARKPRRVGRPRLSKIRRQIIVRFARENFGWGYRRIVGELRKLQLSVSRATIRRVLLEEGLVPPPRSGRYQRTIETPWRKFLRLHMNTLVACDFFTKNVITPFGIRTAYCLFFIHSQSRKVYICSSTYSHNEDWVVQQARNAQMWLDDEGIDAKSLVHDRDTKFSRKFRGCFHAGGIRPLKTPLTAPDASAFAEV